ncbi:MAG: cobalt-precorrin-5B (C(1))-methyltransferase [Pseudomonadota bacterium]
MAERPLRTGWTTGACATAGAKAAVTALLDGQFAAEVSIPLPKGQTPTFALAATDSGAGWAEASIVKDAGDDPDVTHLATITTRVAHGPGGIRFFAGPGVGTVTKPGLPIAPGEPAINPVPREMIAGVLREAAYARGLPTDFDVTISVPGGEELARKTWNPRLGIEGGISILGTTGIVRPFSCAAWIASIHRGIDVARANGLTHVVGATGATSEGVVQGLHDLPEIAYLDMGDFAGGLLKYLREHPVPRITIAGGIGKMTKLGQGALDLHSGRSQVDFSRLAAMAGEHADRVAEANTALEALEIAGAPLAEQVAAAAEETIRSTLRGAPVQVETIVIDRKGTLLARRPFA